MKEERKVVYLGEGELGCEVGDLGFAGGELETVVIFT
jgi:hypothetical protein